MRESSTFVPCVRKENRRPHLSKTGRLDDTGCVRVLSWGGMDGKRKIFNWSLLTVSEVAEGLARHHHGGERGSTQADMVLEKELGSDIQIHRRQGERPGPT